MLAIRDCVDCPYTRTNKLVCIKCGKEAESLIANRCRECNMKEMGRPKRKWDK